MVIKQKKTLVSGGRQQRKGRGEERKFSCKNTVCS